MNIEDIKDIEEGINTIVGYLEYEEDFFDTMDFSGKDKWTVTYNDDQKNELYGKFAITTLQNGILENQQIATLTLKIRDDLSEGETEIKFKNIVSSDGYESISEEDKTVKLIIKNEEVDNVINKTENKTDKPTVEENKEQQEENKEEKENILTGDNVFLYVAIIIGVILVNVIIIVVLKKKKKDDK